MGVKNSKLPFRTPERPTSVHEHHIYVQDTLTHTNWLKYIDSCADILYIVQRCTINVELGLSLAI